MSEAGRITDEAIERLRARIGIPEPHPVAPHYTSPGVDAFRHVAESYGDDNPLWWDEDYAGHSVWEGVIAPPPLVGGDSLIGADEVAEVSPDMRDLMRGDPLRGVHAFYSASAREWWAPLRPGRSVARRNALVGVLDKPSQFAERAVHEWTGQVFQDGHGAILAGQYRLMIRTERTKAREKKKNDGFELRPYADEEIEAIEAQYGGEGPRGSATRWWEDVAEGDSVGPMVKGPLTVTDMICWHVGMGMGLYGVKPLRLGAQNRQAHSAVLPSRRPQRPRCDAAGPLGSRVRPTGREPDHVRLREDAGDVADPPVHRLDGRRRLAVEARLRVPEVQLRR